MVATRNIRTLPDKSLTRPLCHQLLDLDHCHDEKWQSLLKLIVPKLTIIGTKRSSRRAAMILLRHGLVDYESYLQKRRELSLQIITWNPVISSTNESERDGARLSTCTSMKTASHLFLAA